MPPVLDNRARPTLAYPLWNLQHAQSVVHVPDWVRINRAYYDGEHWQNGLGWIGPHPAPGEQGAGEAWAEIARAFTSENIIKEIVDRRMGGVIGREPMWRLVPINPNEDGEPTDEDQALIDEAHNLLTPWWDERGCHEVLQQFVATMLYGERSALRMFIPPGLTQPITIDGRAAGRGLPVFRPADAAAALELLHVAALEPNVATVYTNPDTMRPAGVYLYKVGEQDRAELSYIDAGGMTAIRQIGGSSLAAPPVPLALGGRLPMFEAVHRRFITTQLLQIQRAVNLALTMLPHNIVAGGFLEMIVLGGQTPGHWEPDTDNPGKRKWIPHELVRGASMTQWISPMELGEDNEGKTAISSPSAVFRPIAPLTPLIEGRDALHERALTAANQIHVLMSKDGNASGRSHANARSEFKTTLGSPRARTQRGGRWMIEGALVWLELLTNQPGRWTTKLRCDFQTMLDVGPIGADERAQDLAEVEAGVLSEETARERGGVEDDAAEVTRIRESDRGALSVSKARAEAIQLWQDNGLTFLGACVAAGLTEEEAKALDKFHQDEPEPVDPNDPNDPNAARRRPPVAQ
jgi:hypothetical protein